MFAVHYFNVFYLVVLQKVISVSWCSVMLWCEHLQYFTVMFLLVMLQKVISASVCECFCVNVCSTLL